MAEPMHQNLRPVAIYWDLENIVDLRRPPDENLAIIRAVAQALFRYLLANRLKPALVYSHVFTLSRLAQCIRRALDWYGFQVCRARSRWGQKENAADHLLRTTVEEAIRTDHADARYPSHVVLITGDGGFVDLLCKLREEQRTVLVVSWQDSASRRLVQLANDFVTIEELTGIPERVCHTATAR